MCAIIKRMLHKVKFQFKIYYRHKSIAAKLITTDMQNVNLHQRTIFNIDL